MLTLKQVELLIGDKVMPGKDKRWKREHDGSLKGTEHPNLILVLICMTLFRSIETPSCRTVT
jgi:hypothetical protein